VFLGLGLSLSGSRASGSPAPLTAAALYLGAKTPLGYGAAYGENYLGAGYLKVENASGNGLTKLRYNRFNHLVFAGTVSTSATAPTSIAATYTFDAVEYSDAACTLPTGRSASRTLNTTGIYNRAQVMMPVGVDRVFKPCAAVAIDLAKARFVTEWPASATDPRYAVGDTLLASNTNNQSFCVQELTNLEQGEWLVFCPAAHNEPQMVTHATSGLTGTVDYNLIPKLAVRNASVNTLAAFGGSAPEFETANWYNITTIDPLNTRFGYCKWNTQSADCFTRFIGFGGIHLRPSLDRSTGAVDTSDGNSSGIIFFQGSPRYIRIEGCTFDCDVTPVVVNGITAKRTRCGIFNQSPSSTIAPYAFSVVDSGFGNIFFGIRVASNSALPGEHFTVKRCSNTGDGEDDFLQIADSYNYHITDNEILDRKFQGGAHPDPIQLTTSASTAAGYFPLGEIERNVIRAGIPDLPGSQQGIFLSFASTVTRYYGGRIADNLIMIHKVNAILINHCDGTLIEHNTVQIDRSMGHPYIDSGTPYSNADSPVIAINADCNNVVVQFNIAPAAGVNNQDDGLPSGVSLDAGATGTVILSNRGGVRAEDAATDGHIVTTAGSILPVDAFANPVYGYAPAGLPAAVAAYKAKASGPLDGTGAGGKTIGVWKADGTLASA
jgi:hypothetical protein